MVYNIGVRVRKRERKDYMEKKGNVELYGFHCTPYRIYKELTNETKTNKGLELGMVLSVLGNLIETFPKEQYGTFINLTYLSDLLQMRLKTLRKYIEILEDNKYVKSKLSGHKRYFELTNKGRLLLEIKIKENKNKKED